MSRLTMHAQTKVRGIRIDVKLAEIMIVLWRRGVKTIGSCQGDPDQLGYISFADAKSAVLFASLAKLDLQSGFAGEELASVMTHFAEITGSKFATLWFGEWVSLGNRCLLTARFTPSQRDVMSSWLRYMAKHG
jgi:hypothetical protein